LRDGDGLVWCDKPKFKGPRNIRPSYHTGTWPHEGVDFTDQRVGIIGTDRRRFNPFAER